MMVEDIDHDREEKLLSDLADMFIEFCHANGLDPDDKPYIASRFENFLRTTTAYDTGMNKERE